MRRCLWLGCAFWCMPWLFGQNTPDPKPQSDPPKPTETQQLQTEMATPQAGMLYQLDQNRNFGEAELAPELQDALARLVNTSSEGLQEQIRPDGTVIVDLQGRFQSASVVVIGADGKPVVTCVSTEPQHRCAQHPAPENKPAPKN